MSILGPHAAGAVTATETTGEGEVGGPVPAVPGAGAGAGALSGAGVLSGDGEDDLR